MKNALALFLIASIAIAPILVGCSAGADVGTSGVESKEKQIDEATKKLNGGQVEDRGQGQ